MKKTLTVNVGAMAFIIDEDAYRMLGRYLDDIRSRCEASDADDVMNDIESRVADIFRDNLSSLSQVVDMELVRKVMAIIGRPELFGERKAGFEYVKQEVRRLRRSRTDKVLGGVCGGIASYFNIDVTLVRILTLLLLLLAGMSLWVYIILWIVIPEE